jgi:hypothetical protein
MHGLMNVKFDNKWSVANVILIVHWSRSAVAFSTQVPRHGRPSKFLDDPYTYVHISPDRWIISWPASLSPVLSELFRTMV